MKVVLVSVMQFGDAGVCCGELVFEGGDAGRSRRMVFRCRRFRVRVRATIRSRRRVLLRCRQSERYRVRRFGSQRKLFK